MPQADAAFAGWFLQNPPADFGYSQRCNEKVVVVLLAHPREQGLRRGWFRNIAYDVGVEQVAHQISTSRLKHAISDAAPKLAAIFKSLREPLVSKLVNAAFTHERNGEGT